MKVKTFLSVFALMCSFISLPTLHAECSATGKGYRIFPIKELHVINKSKRGSVTYDSRFDVVASGTYYYSNLSMPVGPIQTEGSSLYYGNPKALTRGLLVKFADGSIALARVPNENFSYKTATKREAEELLNDTIAQLEKNHNKQIVEIMGGGAVLIEHGKRVSRADLERLQFFDQGIGNLVGAQMRATQHVLVATKGQKAYVILSPVASGAKLQADLASFDNVIKFDGASGCSFFVKGSRNLCSGHNVTGLGIKIGQ